MAQPHVIYQAKPGSALDVNREFYARLGPDAGKRTLVERFVIPRRSGRAWPVRAGQIFRIVAVEGPQVADLNVWNLANPRERFWASRSRQLHQAHVSTFDRLWSCLPYLRPMLTITGDSVQYGRDADGGGCHDLLGTRCDPYVHKLLNGEEWDVCCHSNLVRAVAPYHLTELDVLAALSVCPHGDMSKPVWGAGAGDGLDICRPLAIEIWQPASELLAGWTSPAPSDYRGGHGLQGP